MHSYTINIESATCYKTRLPSTKVTLFGNSYYNASNTPYYENPGYILSDDNEHYGIEFGYTRYDEEKEFKIIIIATISVGSFVFVIAIINGVVQLLSLRKNNNNNPEVSETANEDNNKSETAKVSTSKQIEKSYSESESYSLPIGSL